MDRFSELRAFIAVANAGGFAAAARDLAVSRSAVNRLVISLEDRLGAPLLNRSTRKVSLTSDGRVFFEQARRILADLEEAEGAFGASHEEAIGILRISGPLTLNPVNISAAVLDFMTLHPKLRVDLSLEARLVDPIAEGFDLIIRMGQPDESSMLVDHRIAEFQYVACASAAYLEEHGAPKTPRDLKNHRLLHFHGAPNMRTWSFKAPDGKTEEISVQSVLCSNNVEPILDAAIRGFGVAVLPGMAAKDALDRGEIRQVLTDYSLPARILQAIYPPNRYVSAKVRLFTDFLIDRYSGQCEASAVSQT